MKGVNSARYATRHLPQPLPRARQLQLEVDCILTKIIKSKIDRYKLLFGPSHLAYRRKHALYTHVNMSYGNKQHANEGS